MQIFMRIFADFNGELGIGIPLHYIENANFLLCQPPHMHYNAEFYISWYKSVSYRILQKFAHT